jgi:hypothetical protein
MTSPFGAGKTEVFSGKKRRDTLPIQLLQVYDNKRYLMIFH